MRARDIEHRRDNAQVGAGLLLPQTVIKDHHAVLQVEVTGPFAARPGSWTSARGGDLRADCVWCLAEIGKPTNAGRITAARSVVIYTPTPLGPAHVGYCPSEREAKGAQR